MKLTRSILNEVTLYEHQIVISPDDVNAYEENTGLGACGPVAELLRQAGLGNIIGGQVGPVGDYVKSYPHYWIKSSDGRIIDPLRDIGTAKPGEYWDERVVKPTEAPDRQVWGKKDLEYWQNKVKVT